MIELEIDEANLTITIRPKGRLGQADFEKLIASVDKLIKVNGKLNGLIIESERFPGWTNITAMLAHFKFVKGHHKRIKRIALVTNTVIANIAECIISPIISSDIKRFTTGNLGAAKKWVLQS